jgi:pilus assembly protein CpaD
MKPHSCLLAVSLVVVLGGCYPVLNAQYTAVEAPKALTLDNATASIDVRFMRRSSRLLPRDAARLRALAASGAIATSDQVTVATGGSPALADARFATIAAELLRYRIVPNMQPLAGLAPDQAIVESKRYLVTLPPCPNWSKNPAVDFGNAHASNFGCATAVDLAASVAVPADLAEGRPVGLADAIPAAAAEQRYEADKVVLPSAVSLGPISASGSAATGSGATGAGTAGNQP